MKNKNIKRGRVVTPADANPWPHEKQVAEILAVAGHYVEFIPETNIKAPDIYLERTIFEIKSPISNSVISLPQELFTTFKQSSPIVSSIEC